MSSGRLAHGTDKSNAAQAPLAVVIFISFCRNWTPQAARPYGERK